MEIFDRWRVLVVEAVAEEAADDGRLADLRRSEQDHALAVLERRGGDLAEKLRHGVRPVSEPRRHAIHGPG